MDSSKAIKKVVDEIMGYFGLEERAHEPLTTFANILVGIGFDSGRRHASNKGKPVIQMKMDSSTLAVFTTIKEAAAKTGIDRFRISDAAHNRIKKAKGKAWTVKSAGRFKWRLLNPNDYYKQKQVK